MKNILFSIGIATLLTTTGCIIPVREGHGYNHQRYHSRPEVIVAPPPVVVRPPEIIVP
jgi:hypothetical protein